MTPVLAHRRALSFGAADRAPPRGAALALQLPFAFTGALPRSGERPVDPGLGDHLQESGAASCLVLGQPALQVGGPAGVVACVPVWLGEVDEVDDAARRPLRAEAGGHSQISASLADDPFELAVDGRYLFWVSCAPCGELLVGQIAAAHRGHPLLGGHLPERAQPAGAGALGTLE